MKSIRKLLALSFILFLAINLLSAQGSSEGRRGAEADPAARAEKQTDHLTEALSLNDAQVKQVAEINLDYAKKMNAAKAKESDRTAFRALQTERKAAITAVLTPGQASKFETMSSKRPGRKAGKGMKCSGCKEGAKCSGCKKGSKGARSADLDPAARAQRQTQRMTERLELTDEQAKQVAAINLDYAKKMNAAKTAASPEDKAATKTAMKGLWNEKSNAIKAVLTSEQLTKYETMKNRKSGKRGEKGKRGYQGKKL